MRGWVFLIMVAGCHEDHAVVDADWAPVPVLLHGEQGVVTIDGLTLSHGVDGQFALHRDGVDLLDTPVWRLGIPSLTEEESAVRRKGVHALAGRRLEDARGVVFAFAPDPAWPGRSRVMHAVFDTDLVPLVFAWPDGMGRQPSVSVSPGEGTVVVDIRSPAAMVLFPEGEVSSVHTIGDRQWLEQRMQPEPVVTRAAVRQRIAYGGPLLFGSVGSAE